MKQATIVLARKLLREIAKVYSVDFYVQAENQGLQGGKKR
jgi:hypothetical protein